MKERWKDPKFRAWVRLVKLSEAMTRTRAKMDTKVATSVLLTTEETADILGVGTQRVRKMASQGLLRGDKVGRDWVFKETEVRKFASIKRPSGGAGHRNRKTAAA